MDLKVVFLVVSLMTLAIISTDAFIPKCCIRTRDVSHQKLANAQRWELQSSSGICDIDAVIVFIKGQKKPLCAHPKSKDFLEKLMRWRKVKEFKHRKY